MLSVLSSKWPRPSHVARPLAAALAIAILALPTGAVPAAAASNADCSEPGSAHNRWSGQAVGGQKHGVAGEIEGQALLQCNNPVPTWEESGSFAFVNIEGQGFYSIVQAGVGLCRAPFFPDCDWTMNVIATWGRSTSAPGCAGFSDVPPLARRVAEVDGAVHNYKVVHEQNEWRMLRGFQVLGQSRPESDICWTPNEATWFGESHDLGDAIGGSVGNKFFIRGANYANAENGGFFWTSWNASNACNITPGTPDVNGPPFFCDIVNATQINIWTNR